MRRNGKTMCGGMLMHVATISQPSATTDGETKPTWSNLVAGVPVSRIWRSGRETVNQSQVQSVANERIRMVHRTDVTPQMRIRFSNPTEVLEIVSCGDPFGDTRWLDCECLRIEST